MKYIIPIIIALAGISGMHAQDFSKFKALSDSTFRNSTEYQQANKYQKDAILFLEMLADTHPYYVKKDRQGKLMAKKDALLAKCADCTSDSLFCAYLQEALGLLRDKHTDVIDLAQWAQKKQPKPEAEPEPEAEQQSDAVMARKKDLFAYQIFEQPSICYLQFNQCADARTMRNDALPRFDTFLDSMFCQMDSLKVQTLVVDVQYNNGGSSRLCDELLAHLYPVHLIKNFNSQMRFSNLAAAYNPRIGVAKTAWENDGHAEELPQAAAHGGQGHLNRWISPCIKEKWCGCKAGKPSAVPAFSSLWRATIRWAKSWAKRRPTPHRTMAKCSPIACLTPAWWAPSVANISLAPTVSTPTTPP